MNVKFENAKQVNAVLVALDSEIDVQFERGRADWQFFPNLAAMLEAYYITRTQYERGLKK